jgi:hypothetical protein
MSAYHRKKSALCSLFLSSMNPQSFPHKHTTQLCCVIPLTEKTPKKKKKEKKNKRKENPRQKGG